MGEGPLGHVAPLLPRLHVRKAEVDPLVDAGVDHVRGGVREPVIRAYLLEGAGFVVVTEKVISSVPKKRARARVAAPVTLLAPEV
jgi:hypothetical protein